MNALRPLSVVPAAVPAGAAGLHVAWGLESSLPYPKQSLLADAVASTAAVPPRSACFVVAAELAAGAGPSPERGAITVGRRWLGWRSPRPWARAV